VRAIVLDAELKVAGVLRVPASNDVVLHANRECSVAKAPAAFAA
jgi:hypothetical protein